VEEEDKKPPILAACPDANKRKACPVNKQPYCFKGARSDMHESIVTITPSDACKAL